MADDIPPGELAHRLVRAEQRLDDLDKGQKHQDDRVAKTASHAGLVSAVADLRGEMGRMEGELKADLRSGLRDLKDDVRRDLDAAERRADERFKGVEARTQFSRTQIIAIIAIIVPLVTALVGIIAAGHGV